MPAKKSKKPRVNKGYSRVDSDKTNSHGWLVRIRRGGTMKSSFVSDNTHGGKRKSQAVAAELYEQWTAELPPIATSLDRMSIRNATGVVGVHFADDGDSRYPNCKYQSYIASWLDENGKRKKLGFSCNKYGEDAFTLACIAREKRLTDREKVLALFARRSKSKSASKPVKKKATAKKVSKKVVKKKVAKKKVAKKARVKKTAAKKR